MALILIVDDSPTEVFQMRRLLENHGFETEAAADGAEGIRKAREIRPDLILMDIVMPGVDGFKATRALANDPTTRAIPVIMVSSVPFSTASKRRNSPTRSSAPYG
jgi:twitching motility two-component system response regulator PilH